MLREFGNNENLQYAENVSFPENQIIGGDIRHIENGTDIELAGGNSYFVKYTVSYSVDNCRCSGNTNSREVIFALTDGNNMIILGSQHVASVSEELYSNSISLGVIIRQDEDYVLRLTNLTRDIENVRIEAATVTVFRLE